MGRRLHHPPRRGAPRRKRQEVGPRCANTRLDLGRRPCHGPLHGRLHCPQRHRAQHFVKRTVATVVVSDAERGRVVTSHMPGAHAHVTGIALAWIGSIIALPCIFAFLVPLRHADGLCHPWRPDFHSQGPDSRSSTCAELTYLFTATCFNRLRLFDAVCNEAYLRRAGCPITLSGTACHDSGRSDW